MKSPTTWVLIVLVITVVIAVIREPLKRYLNDCREYDKSAKSEWTFCAYGGGTLKMYDMDRKEAVTYCTQNLGTVTYVDDDRQFVFYKSEGWQRAAFNPQNPSG
jgi:hypothetical protein